MEEPWGRFGPSPWEVTTGEGWRGGGQNVADGQILQDAVLGQRQRHAARLWRWGGGYRLVSRRWPWTLDLEP